MAAWVHKAIVISPLIEEAAWGTMAKMHGPIQLLQGHFPNTNCNKVVMALQIILHNFKFPMWTHTEHNGDLQSQGTPEMLLGIID